MSTRLLPSKSSTQKAGLPGKQILNWITIFVLVLMALNLTNGSSAVASQLFLPRTIPPGYSSEVIQVKFREGADIDPPEMALPPELRNSAVSLAPLFSVSKQKLNEIRARGEANIKAGIFAGIVDQPIRSLPDLSLWFRITLKPGTDAAAFIEKMKLLDNVETVEPAPLPLPPPAVTPDFTGNQGYLNAAPGGVDARFSWLIPGGNGSGVTIYDVEYGWLQTHEDLSKANGVPLLLEPGDSNYFPMDTGHGTAALGELIADNDEKGVTGISWGANIGLAPVWTTNLGFNPANAILLAASDGKPGDVILIESQQAVCGSSDLGPSEWDTPVFDAIQTATANRFVVVEAAGNGGVDLDQSACGGLFDRDVRDSGAIIVGAGGSAGSTLDRQRLSFSSYGSRVDVQAWGENVMTTGYGDFYTNQDDPDNPNFWYTNIFDGTSSASPIVAGAAANLQGIAIQRFGTPLTAFQVRALLAQTGSPQLGNTVENIGPRPDLRAAINRLIEGSLDVYFLIDNSGSMIDDIAAVKSAAQGVINTVQTSNPDTQFGLGKFEDYPIDPFGVAAFGDKAYEQVIDLTDNTEDVLNAINGLNPVDPAAGGDIPQSQLAALLQSASGAGQTIAPPFEAASISPEQQANFRDGEAGVTKLILLYTDAPFHLPGDPGAIPYPGPSFVETVDAILAADPPKVIGISSGGGGLSDLQAIASATDAFAPPGGVDCDTDEIIDIPEGEPLVCIISSSGEGIGEAIVAIVEAALPIIVDIDIKPGIGDNSINCSNAQAVIPVAILTTETFDATTVDDATVTFEGASEIHRNKNSGAPVRHQEDVDGDGDIDLLFHFRLGDTTLTCGSTLGTLVGQTFDGLEINGIDSIRMVP